MIPRIEAKSFSRCQLFGHTSRDCLLQLRYQVVKNIELEKLNNCSTKIQMVTQETMALKIYFKDLMKYQKG